MHIELKINGMHCKSCETLIIDELSSLEGISNPKADSKKGTVSFEAEGKGSLEKARKAITGLGYSVLD